MMECYQNYVGIRYTSFLGDEQCPFVSEWGIKGGIRYNAAGYSVELRMEY